MASLMQDWILSFVKQELEKAIDWKKSRAHDTKDRSSDYSFVKDEEQTASNHLIARRSITDDGSNLRVSIDLSAGYEHAVQIVKYLEYEHPVKAVMSDSHTSIVAKFSKAATDIYERNNHGRRLTKITAGGIITICRCEIVATTYGPDSERLSLLITEFVYRGCGGSSTFGHPSSIEQNPEVEDCVKDMIKAKNSETNYKNQQQSKKSHNAEEASSEVDDKNAVFQTQASHITDQLYCDSQLVHDVRDESHEAENIRGVNSDGPRAPAVANVAKRSGGLDIDTGNKSIKPSKIQKESGNTTYTNAYVNEASNKSVKELDQKITKLTGRSTKIAKHSPSKSSESVPGQMSLDKSPKPTDNAPAVPEWLPLRAITRRSCLVPSDQMKLLSRRESWMPSEPGVQFPLANIPIKILDELKNSAQKHKKKKYDDGARKQNRGDNLNFESDVSYMTQSQQSSSDELSWAATNSDLEPGGLPPDSSFLQDQLSVNLDSSQTQQRVNKAAKNDMPIGNPSKEWRSDQSDEDSGLEMCLPGEMHAKAGQSLNNLYHDAKLKRHEKQDTLNSGSRPKENHQFSLQSKVCPHVSTEMPRRGELPKTISTTIIPNTPSRGINQLHSPGRKQCSDDHKVHKTWNDPSVSRPIAERTNLIKDDMTISQTEVLDNEKPPSTFINNSSLGLETYERDYGSSGYNSSAGRKKLKIQHSAQEPIENSPAFLQSACQAQEAKRDFLHMLAATKMNSSYTDMALTSSFVNGRPVEKLSHSSPEHFGDRPAKFTATTLKGDDSGQHSDDRLQLQESTGRLKSATVPSISQGNSVNFRASAIKRRLSAEDQSVTVSQGNEKSNESARTIPSSPIVNNIVYLTFREVYSDYTGDLKHFLGICKSIDLSQQTGSAQHRSLWDDFVVKHITDYGPYLISCNAAEEKPIPYEQYYRDRVDEPCHNKRVLTPESLREALDLSSRASPAASIGINNFQPFNNSANSIADGSCTSSRQRRGKDKGYSSFSPTSIQWRKEGRFASQAEVTPRVGDSMHTSSRRGKNAGVQKSPQYAIRSSAKVSSGHRENYHAYYSSAATSRNSSQSRKHVSRNRTIPFASSPFGGSFVGQGSGAGRADQTPSSERSRKTDQNRPSKPLPAPLHYTEKRTKKPSSSSSSSSLPLPLSSSSSINCLPLSRSPIHTQAQSNNDGDANDMKVHALQYDTKNDRGSLRDVLDNLHSSLQKSNSPPTLPAVVTARAADETATPIKQTHESSNKANVSSLPISSTTNQILQQTLLEEQLRNQHDKGLQKNEVTETEHGPNPNLSWQKQYTVFKKFASCYAQLKNVNGSLGMPVAEGDKMADMRCSEIKGEKRQKRECDRQRKKRSANVLAWEL